MLNVVAYGLAVLIDLLVVFIGLRFLLQPVSAAAGYGVPAERSAYLTIKGMRDFTYGILGLVLLAFAGTEAAALMMLVAAVLPFGDTVIVLRNGGTRAVAFGVHFATGVLLLISAALLFAA